MIHIELPFLQMFMWSDTIWKHHFGAWFIWWQWTVYLTSLVYETIYVVNRWISFVDFGYSTCMVIVNQLNYQFDTEYLCKATDASFYHYVHLRASIKARHECSVLVLMLISLMICGTKLSRCNNRQLGILFGLISDTPRNTDRPFPHSAPLGCSNGSWVRQE
jgi:hypothetical protein